MPCFLNLQMLTQSLTGYPSSTALVTTTNRAKCPEFLEAIAPGLLVPAQVWASRVRTIKEGSKWTRRSRALAKRLAAKMDFREMTVFMGKRLNQWYGTEVAYGDMTDVAIAIVALGSASQKHLVPPPRANEGLFLQRLRDLVEAAESVDDELASNSSVSVQTASSRAARRVVERSAGELSRLAAHHARAATELTLHASAPAVAETARAAAEATTHAALAAAGPQVESAAREAGHASALGALHAAEPRVEHMARAAAHESTQAALAAAGPRVEQVARDAAREMAGAAETRVAAVEADLRNVRHEVRRAADATAASIAELRQLLLRGRETAQHAREHTDRDDDSSDSGDVPGFTPRNTNTTPGMTSTSLYNMRTWERAVGTAELTRLAEELVAASPVGTGRLFSRAALDAAIGIANAATARGDRHGAVEAVTTVVARVIAACHVHASGLGKSDRGVREALGAVLESDDLTLATASRTLKALEPFLGSPPTGRGWRGGPGRGAGNGARGQRTAGKK